METVREYILRHWPADAADVSDDERLVIVYPPGVPYGRVHRLTCPSVAALRDSNVYPVIHRLRPDARQGDARSEGCKRCGTTDVLTEIRAGANFYSETLDQIDARFTAREAEEKAKRDDREAKQTAERRHRLAVASATQRLIEAHLDEYQTYYKEAEASATLE